MRYGTLYAQFFRAEAGFTINVEVFAAPGSVIIIRVDIACCVKPGIVAKTDVTQHRSHLTMLIYELDEAITEGRTLARIKRQQLLQKCCMICIQF